MTYADDLKAALNSHLGRDHVRLLKRWSVVRSTPWRGPDQVPLALVLHHTAGAVTDSVDPSHAGNLRNANKGQVDFIESHFTLPAANFTLDRDGTVYVHCAYPVFHCGLGSFTDKDPWNKLDIPDNLGANYMLGVEIVSKGLKEDFTDAQKTAVVLLLRACGDASGWEHPRGPKALLRRPRHTDWAGPRKVDILYAQDTVGEWIDGAA